ncbi:hypothetical protein LCGC14_1922460 [marine sediment metagenome]|uniref:Uncharacterized protein n=1 Tax=marine sediment metagenome TaxID=412755 RepID=A0A0F9I4A7_9ZZZZ
MSKDRDLLITLSEAVVLLLDHALHRPSLDRHNKVRSNLNEAIQAKIGDQLDRETEKRDGLK